MRTDTSIAPAKTQLDRLKGSLVCRVNHCTDDAWLQGFNAGLLLACREIDYLQAEEHRDANATAIAPTKVTA